jgi:type I restriction enzyme, S subunit
MNNIVPENWNSCKIGDHIKVLTDYTANGSFASLKENVRYFSEKNYAALVRLTDLEKDAFDPQRFTDKKGYEYLKKSNLKSGDIVIANVGSTGKAYRIPNASIPMTLAPNMYLIKFHDSLDEDFAFQLITNQQFYSDLISKIGSSTLNAINKSNFRSISILKPPLPEQKKIASILTSVDEVIEKTQKQIDKLQDLKKATMNELLTKGIGHTEFKDSDLGRIPKSWEVKKLGQLGNFKNGINKPKQAFGSGTRFVNISDAYSVNLDCRSLERVEVSANELIAYKLEPNDLVFVRSSVKLEGVAIPTIFSGYDEEVIFCGFMIRFRSQSTNIIPDYLREYLITDKPRILIQRIATGGANININQESLSEFKVLLPTKGEQEYIVRMTKSANVQIIKLIVKLKKFQSLKKSLMQDLLTGKVRVSVN